MISVMASNVNSGNEKLDKKIDQWLAWDKVRITPIMLAFFRFIPFPKHAS